MKNKLRTKNFKHLNSKLKNNEIILMRNAFINSMSNACPLNRHITINVEQLIDSKNYQHLFRLFRDMYMKFAKSKGFQPAFVMVVEIGESVGLHIHILIHVPSCSIKKFIINFKKRVKKQLMNLTGLSKIDKSSIHFQTIGFGKYLNRPDYYEKLIDLVDEIINLQSRMSAEEIALYQLNKIDNPKWYLVKDIDLLQIFNYLSKGIAFRSEGSFYARRFSCSKWLKKTPWEVDYLKRSKDAKIVI